MSNIRHPYTNISTYLYSSFSCCMLAFSIKQKIIVAKQILNTTVVLLNVLLWCSSFHFTSLLFSFLRAANTLSFARSIFLSACHSEEYFHLRLFVQWVGCVLYRNPQWFSASEWALGTTLGMFDFDLSIQESFFIVGSCSSSPFPNYYYGVDESVCLWMMSFYTR